MKLFFQSKKVCNEFCVTGRHMQSTWLTVEAVGSVLGLLGQILGFKGKGWLKRSCSIWGVSSGRAKTPDLGTLHSRVCSR